MSRRGLSWYRAIAGRSRTSLAVSVGVHAALVFALLNMAFRYPVGAPLGGPHQRPSAEGLRYVRVSPELPGSGAGGRLGAAASPGPTATTRLRAPGRVPVGIPQTPGPPATTSGTADRGGVAGGRDDVTAATGIQPAYADPRLWPQPGPFTPVPKTAAQRADSAVKAAFGIFADSLAAAEANKGRAPTDWTFERNGQKWGLDDRYIHLGKVKIPSAVLALLPLNAQANPTFNDPVTRRESAFRAGDILYHANRAVSEDEFRRAVKRIRERKDRERAAARTENANGDGHSPVAIPGASQK